MALEPGIQGATYLGQRVTLILRNGTMDLTGAAITGRIQDIEPGGVARAITGTLSVVDGPNRVIQWAYSAADVATPGEYTVQFRATVGGAYYLSFPERWTVQAAI